MKYFVKSDYLLKIGFFILMLGAVQSVAGSQIFGTVYDNRRNALPNVNVELLNENRSLVKVTTTDGIGRYTFNDLGDGRWYVRVLPFRYDFDESIQEIMIETIKIMGGASNTTEIMDFILTPRKGTLAEAQAQVIYAQEIPSEAKKAFEAGQKLEKKGKTDEAIASYQEAVKVFPDYFLANHYLGATYFNKKDFEHAVPLLIKAAQINEKSSVTLYYLGYSLHQLNYNKAAIVALKAAAVLTPSSPAIFATLGATQRFERDYAEAEKNLLQAKKLSKTENSELYKELAALYGETKQYEKGAESLEQMLKSGTFSEDDIAKIKQQIKVWKDISAKQATKSGT